MIVPRLYFSMYLSLVQIYLCRSGLAATKWIPEGALFKRGRNWLFQNLKSSGGNIAFLEDEIRRRREMRNTKSPEKCRDNAFFFKSTSYSPDDDAMVFCLFSSSGRLSDVHLLQIQSFVSSGFVVFIVVNSGQPQISVEQFEKHSYPEGVNVLIRENHGFDFGAWRHALEADCELEVAKSVTFANDSVLPIRVNNLRELRESISAGPGVNFLTGNDEVRPHGQSYFFTVPRFSFKAARSILLASPLHETKDDVIRWEEVFLMKRLLISGVGVNFIFADPYGRPRNSTIRDWETLLSKGFPFIKIQLFTLGLLDIDNPRLEGWIDEKTRESIKSHLHARLS